MRTKYLVAEVSASHECGKPLFGLVQSSRDRALVIARYAKQLIKLSSVIGACHWPVTDCNHHKAAICTSKCPAHCKSKYNYHANRTWLLGLFMSPSSLQAKIRDSKTTTWDLRVRVPRLLYFLWVFNLLNHFIIKSPTLLSSRINIFCYDIVILISY